MSKDRIENKTAFENYMRYIVGTEFLLSVTRSSRRKTILKTEWDLNVKGNYLYVEIYGKKNDCLKYVKCWTQF